jgi:hypothetical protein
MSQLPSSKSLFILRSSPSSHLTRHYMSWPIENSSLCKSKAGRVIAQEVSSWLPTAAARVRAREGKWCLWWSKRHWGRFSSSTSVSPANHHSTNFSIITITRGWHKRPIGGRSAEWTQFGLHPPLYQLKKLIKSRAFLFRKSLVRITTWKEKRKREHLCRSV